MIRHSCPTATVLFLTLMLGGAKSVHAQPPEPAPPPAADTAAATPSAGDDMAALADDDDDARLRPMEPDYSLVNLPTTLPLPVHGGNFHLTHRFNENLAKDTAKEQLQNLFGLDEGATIDFEYRFGLFKHVQLIASRTNVDRTISLGTKVDAFHQTDSMPLGISAIFNVEGGNNFSERYAPTLGVVVSRTIASKLALYATPIVVHNTLPDTGEVRNTFFVGLGTRIRIRPTLYVVVEGSPRAAGYTPGNAEFAFSLEARVGAHVFAITFANSSAVTYGQLARGGNPDSLYLGFNLSRKFF
ncbi:MAG TPA: DUF5777 family beta-barrel protein [Vicinamibacterales bacterium]